MNRIILISVFDGELELSIVDINRFLRLKKTKLSPSGQGLTPSVANPSLLCDEGAKDKLIQVHYINCQYIFEREECHAKTIVDLNPDIFTMKQLRSYIIKTEGFDLCQVSVELYSKEGYPLSTNECTSKSKLVLNVTSQKFIIVCSCVHALFFPLELKAIA